MSVPEPPDDANEQAPPPDSSQVPGGNVAKAAQGAEQAALKGKDGTGAATAAGLARDAAEGVSAASEGRVGDATEAATRAAATGVATYFGGTAGGDATRRALNTAPGRAATKSVKWIVIVAVVASLLLPVLLIGAIASSVMSVFNQSTVAANCVATGGRLAYDGGKGGIWAMQFLHAQGLRGEPLKVMWSIVMRESGGDPNLRAPETGTYNNGTYDAGLYQTNSSNSGTLAQFGLTMEDAYDPLKAFNFWMRRASPNNKIMTSLAMWGLNSWEDPTLNTRNYQNWSPEQWRDWIVVPFREKYATVDDAARQAGVSIGNSADTKVALPPLGDAPGVVLTATGTASDFATPAPGSPDAGSVPSYGPGNPAPNVGNIPEDQLTVSGWEALKPGDSRLRTYTVAGRNVTTHEDYERLFTDFLTAWDQDPDLGQGRLSFRTGDYFGSYNYRKARVTTSRWSDHAGYAVDIRWDILPPFQGRKMTEKETEATRRLLERFPQLGWGGNYDEQYMDEMHFYVAPGANVQPSANPCTSFAGDIPPTGELQRRALEWALAITGGTYNYDVNTNPDKRPPDYNCSTLTSAAYRFASSDGVNMIGNSASQWMDTRNIALVPFSEAQPGDIFFEKTINDRGNPVGHVGLIVNVAGGDEAIWHACGASSCQSNGNIGIGYSSLDHVKMWMTVENGAKANDPAERRKFKWTTNRNEAYVGRVIDPGDPSPKPEQRNDTVQAAVAVDVTRKEASARRSSARAGR